MSNQEIEMSDVIVVLDELDDDQTKVVVSALAAVGMNVESVDNENSVVEGCVETCKVADIRRIEHVRYVRNVFNYDAERAVDGAAGSVDSGTDQYED